MLELIMVGAAVLVMYRIAEAEDLSGLLWGVITFVICVGAMFLTNWFFVRIIGAALLAFVSMFAYNVLSNR